MQCSSWCEFCQFTLDIRNMDKRCSLAMVNNFFSLMNWADMASKADYGSSTVWSVHWEEHKQSANKHHQHQVQASESLQIASIGSSTID